MKGSVWCHLSSSCRKQVCLKYFARLPHVDASSSRCAVGWNSFVKEAFISSDGPQVLQPNYVLIC